MRRFGLATLIVAFFALVFTFIPKSAWTQGVVQLCYYTNTFVCQVVSVANPLPVNASVSASISGFTAATTGTPISVTTSNSTGTLPAGAVVVATNVGATNAAYCALGAAATTSSQYLSPGGGWFAFTVGASTQLTCVTSTSTTTVNMTGGAGLPTGTGGGSGGGGGGAVTVADGANVVEGATADAAATAGSTGTVSAKLRLMTTQLSTIATNTGAAIPAGTALIGYTSPDPCQQIAKTSVAISQTANTQLFAGTTAKKSYICSLAVIAADAENLSLVAGTGTVCATGIAAVIGGTTAANGPNFAANGGLTLGNGMGTIAAGATNADNICLLQSGSGRVAGVLTYVQQ